jgi:hypothetical protein
VGSGAEKQGEHKEVLLVALLDDDELVLNAFESAGRGDGFLAELMQGAKPGRAKALLLEQRKAICEELHLDGEA